MKMAVLDYVRDYCRSSHYGPTYDEIAEVCAISKSTAYHLVGQLVALGRLQRKPGKNRTLWYVEDEDEGKQAV